MDIVHDVRAINVAGNREQKRGTQNIAQLQSRQIVAVSEARHFDDVLIQRVQSAEFLRKNGMRNVDVFYIVPTVRDAKTEIVMFFQIVVKVGVNALNRRSVNRFAVERFAGDFDPDAPDDADIVFEKQIDDSVQKSDGVPLDAMSAAHGVAAQVGAFDFGDDAVKVFVGFIVQMRIVAVFQPDEIVSQIVQAFVVDENAADCQNGLVVAVGIFHNGQSSQIPRFVDVANFNHTVLRYN